MKYFMGILIFAIISCPAVILGQPTLAIRGGVNLTTLTVRDTNQYPMNAHTNVELGVSADIPIRGRLGFQLMGNYVQKGAYDFLYEFPIEIDYIEFSGLANIILVAPRRAPSLSLLAGPTMAFKIKSTGEDRLARRHWKDRFEFKTLDFGIAVGVGTQVPVSKTVAFRSELVLTHGIGVVNKTPAYMTNRALSFCIGFGFPVSRLGGG